MSILVDIADPVALGADAVPVAVVIVQGMSDTQLLRDILAELKKVNAKLEKIDSSVAGVERAVYDQS